MTHGWPGSVFELLKTIGPLTDPTAHGGRAEDAWSQFERSGRIDWVTDLAEIPAKAGARGAAKGGGVKAGAKARA